MTGFRAWWKRSALALAALAAGVAVSASAPNGDGWVADPDSQYLFDLNIRQLRLAENLRAYPTPQGQCLVLGDLLTMLDLPVTVDLQARRASGWAFRQDNRIEIDRARGEIVHGTVREAIAPGDLRDTPEGWCADSAALSRWLGVEFKIFAGASSVMIESKAKLPVELARERLNRAKYLHKAALPLESGPAVKIPYRMWRAPALDFVVDAGITYSATSGVSVDRRASIAAAGEIGGLSYDARIVGGQARAVEALRFRAYRSNPDGGLLGPLDATHFGLGDVAGLSHPLLGGQQGRGFEITNKPLFAPHSFDRTRFEGELQPGWQAEIYRNGQLLDFAGDDGSGRYHFDEVDLSYGDNQFEIILYGPQGQQESRFETINVGPEQLPPGETRYWAGANQPSRDLLGVMARPAVAPGTGAFEGETAVPDAQAAFQLEHGLDKRTSVAAMAATLLVGDEKLTFVEGSVRRAIGPALVEAGVAYAPGGGKAFRAQALARIGEVAISAEAATLDHFYYDGRLEGDATKLRVTLDAPVKLGKVPLGVHGEYRLLQRGDQRHDRAEARLSGNFGRIYTGAGVGWERETLAGGIVNERFDLKTLASGRVGKVRLRGQAVWDLSPAAGLRTADVSAYWSASDRADWEVGLGYDSTSSRTRARLSHVHRFDAFAATATVEAASDRSFAAGINLSFSLDSSRGGIKPVRQPLASSGQVKARLFRDDNNNGLRDPGELAEAGVLLTGGAGAEAEPSGKDGVAILRGLTAYRPVAVGIDGSTLADPALAPRNALQTVVPRPGVTATIDIPLVGAGDIEGILVAGDGAGLEGIDIEVLDRDGRVLGTARTDFDGFFLFERLPYGSYRFRLVESSAKAAKLATSLDVEAVLSAERSVARLGPVTATKAVTLAAR